MKKILLLTAALFFSTTVLASTLSIGVVDVQQILQQSPQVKVLQGQLKKQFTPQEKKIVAAHNQLMTDMKKLNRDSAIMKASDKKALQSKITKEQQDFQKMQVDFQQGLTKAQNDAMQSIVKDIQAAVGKIAASKKLTLVIAKSSVAYNASDLDITSAVLAAMK